MRSVCTIIFVLAVGSVSAQQLDSHYLGCDPAVCGYASYYEHAPTNASTAPADTHGLLVFLHGTKGDGWFDNLEYSFDQKRGEGLPYYMQHEQVLADYEDDYFVFMPFDDSENEFDADILDVFINWVLDNNPSIDRDRVVLMGYSKGAKGVLDYAAFHGADMLAGAMPVMGGIKQNSEDSWCNMNQFPIWGFGSEFDALLPPNGTSSGTQRKGIKIVMDYIDDHCPNFNNTQTILQSKGHDGWDELYSLRSGFPIYQWMAQLDRSTNMQNHAPLVQLDRDRKILNTNTQWIVYAHTYDMEKDPLTLTWDVEPASVTLATPNFTVSDEGYITLTNLQTGSYVISLDVSDGSETAHDEMTLDVVSPTGQKYVSRINFRYPGIAAPVTLENGSVIDLNQIPSAQLLNLDLVAHLNTGTSNMSFAINENMEYMYSRDAAQDISIRNVFPGSQTFGLPASTTRQYTITATPTSPGGATYGISTQVTAFFTNDPEALPVKLLSFTGHESSEGVKLDWSTTDEQGNSHFEIFRGRSREVMQKVGEVPRAEVQQDYNYYSFLDQEATGGGIYYYRLESVDFDGHRDKSEIIRVALPGKLAVYPNPARNGTFFVTTPKGAVPSFELVNSNGQRVSYTLRDSKTGSGEKEVVIESPAPGIYLLKAYQEGQFHAFKVVVPN